ncbi:MAG: hypothetical protein M5U14_00785 [Acidimicrobiia bacterium]|nr:hypothetical protein [Acidimicrobiia bacterium]
MAAAAALLVSLGLLAAIPDAADVVELALVGGGATLVYVATLLPRNPLLEWRTVLRPGQPA